MIFLVNYLNFPIQNYCVMSDFHVLLTVDLGESWDVGVWRSLVL